jgi:hypothetical protein
MNMVFGMLFLRALGLGGGFFERLSESIIAPGDGFLGSY